MDLRKLKTLIDLVSESGIAELDITEGDDHVRIVNRATTVTTAAPVAVAPTIVSAAPVAAPVLNATPVENAKTEDRGTPITSPMVGTFYRAPSPGAEPFVKEGDTVKKGQVIGIIEAMKLLNEVEADQDGVIAEFAVENGQPVEFGQPLLFLK